jgi:hypothetical protein
MDGRISAETESDPVSLSIQMPTMMSTAAPTPTQNETLMT